MGKERKAREKEKEKKKKRERGGVPLVSYITSLLGVVVRETETPAAGCVPRAVLFFG